MMPYFDPLRIYSSKTSFLLYLYLLECWLGINFPDRDGGIVGFAMACSNTFGLVTGAFLLGFGLSEIPRNIWKNADWSHRQKVLSHRVAKMAVKLDSAHQEYSNAIVVSTSHKLLSNNIQLLSFCWSADSFQVAQATSNQMSKRDLLRPYMDIIDNMLAQMVLL